MPNHAGVVDGGVVANRLLDFDWGHLEPGYLDHVLDTVDDPESTVGVDHGEIAGAEQAVGTEGGCVGPRVSGSHTGPADLEFTEGGDAQFGPHGRVTGGVQGPP